MHDLNSVIQKYQGYIVQKSSELNLKCKVSGGNILESIIDSK